MARPSSSDWGHGMDSAVGSMPIVLMQPDGQLLVSSIDLPDLARRAGLSELVSILGKLRLRVVTPTGAANVFQRKRSTRRSDAGSINADRRESIASG